MKKILFVIVAIILLLFVWAGESRKFFKMSNGNYVTLWKTYNNVSFIVPGKYYSPLPPGGTYIQTSNINSVSIYQKKVNGDTIFFESLFDYELHQSETPRNFFFDLKKSGASNLNLIMNKEMDQRDFSKWSILHFQIKEGYARDEKGKIQR